MPDRFLESPLERAAYSDRTAWLMATLSRLAYMPFDREEEARRNITATLADANLYLQKAFSDPDTGTQGFLAVRPGEFTVLVFRGTEKDRKDIFADLDTRFYKTPAGKAHRGFAVAYESVRNHIVPALEDLRERGELHRLFITGHSLGGALATVASHDLENRFLVSGCYTFGSPRVGNAEWSDTVKTPVYRVVNGADGVPLVPPGALVRKGLAVLPTLPGLGWLEVPVSRLLKRGYAGFQHAGDLRFLKGSKDAAQLKIGSIAAWERFKHVVFEWPFKLIKKFSSKALSAVFSDHGIAEYEGKLRKIVEDRN